MEKPSHIAKPEPPAASARRLWLSVLITSAAVTACSYLAPTEYAATAVAVCFLGATWWLVLRHDAATIRSYGLGMGGLLEPGPIDRGYLLKSALRGLGFALLLSALFLPPFVLGFKYYYRAHLPFVLLPPESPLDAIAGQLLVIALPEEAFYRGFVQTELDRMWKGRIRVLGAELGWSILVASALFAVGHVLTNPNPARLAVFFPALLFGWLRARTRGIGAGVLFHAMCNLFSSLLSRGYGLG